MYFPDPRYFKVNCIYLYWSLTLVRAIVKCTGLLRWDLLEKSFMSVATNYLFAQVTEHAQMSAKAGIKCFGDRAVAAMLRE